jgi:hypothetical protein
VRGKNAPRFIDERDVLHSLAQEANCRFESGGRAEAWPMMPPNLPHREPARGWAFAAWSHKVRGALREASAKLARQD